MYKCEKKDENVRHPSESLSNVFRLLAHRLDKDSWKSLHHRSILRLHTLFRLSGKKSELGFAVEPPTINGISMSIYKALDEDSVLLAVEYEIDDGCGHQHHGDLLFWEPMRKQDSGVW